MATSSFSARRMGLIAKRDFLGYVRTWGFWLTALGPFIGILCGIGFPLLMKQSEPAHYTAILDDTGAHKAAIEQLFVDESDRRLKTALTETAKLVIPREQRGEFERILEDEGIEAAQAYMMKTSPRLTGMMTVPSSKLELVDPPENTIDGLIPYVKGETLISIGERQEKLVGVMHITQKDGKPVAEFWSISPTGSPLINLTNRYFSGLSQDKLLEGAGLSQNILNEARKNAIKVTALNPNKSEDGKDGQKASTKDIIPYLIAAGLSMLLWFTVFTGAYMLLVSMVEEKINKVLEMLLASTRFSEIFFGKLLGVAALTLASLLPWILLGAFGFFVAMQFGDGALVDGLAKVMTTKMLIFLPIFFVLGYIFYGSMFIALGALAESMQDASTLMTPMVLLLTGCLMVVPIGIAYPDSPILIWAEWFPFSAPFAAIIRLPSDPPFWETLGSVVVLIIASIFVMRISGRLFQHGVLSGSGMAGVKAWFTQKIRRQNNAPE